MGALFSALLALALFDPGVATAQEGKERWAFSSLSKNRGDGRGLAASAITSPRARILANSCIAACRVASGPCVGVRFS